MRTLAAILAATLAPSCSLPRFDVAPRYGQFNVDGNFGASSSGNVVENSLSDAGIEDDDGMGGLRADFKWGLVHLVTNVQQSKHDGDGTLSADIDLGGTTINAGADVETDFDLGLYNALLLFDFLPTDMFELNVGLGVSGLDIDAKFEEVGTGTTIETDELLPVPVVCLGAGVQLSRFEVAGILSAMDASYEGNDVEFYDFDAFGRFAFFRPDSLGRVSILAGYRLVDVNAEYEDGGDNVSVDATFDGPYLGLEISF
jgi:hypothetical protein